MNMWTGVVENRDDPEKLGRVKVRIFGYHTENAVLLPTQDLPWALVSQSTTSAATSGIGSTPVGILPGTWVVGIFLDGQQAQQPLIIGTIAGKPESKVTDNQKEKIDPNLLKDISGNYIYDQTGKLKRLDKNVSIKKTFQPLTETDVSKLITALGKQLSNNSYSKEGDYGELGKYQFTVANLIDLGYVSPPINSSFNKSIFSDDNNWTGKEGITSKAKFLASGTTQDNAMLSYLKGNYVIMKGLNKFTEDSNRGLVAGLLCSAHILGPYYADNLDKKDSYGNLAKVYYDLGITTIGLSVDNVPELVPYNEVLELEDLNTIQDVVKYNQQLAKSIGFKDPGGQYPKKEYDGKSDINKLALDDRSHGYFVTKESKQVFNIPIANSSNFWDEPNSAYSAVYPYNQVIETEAGHVIELDNTPNAERIHLFHKSGSYIEIDVNGTSVRKVTGDNFEILDRNDSVYVKGAKNLTVEGKTSILVKNDATIEVDGNLNVTGHGDAVVQVAKNLAVFGKKVEVSSKEALNLISDGPVSIQGSSVGIYGKDNLALKSNKDLAIQSGGTAGIKAKLAIKLQALVINQKMGAVQARFNNFNTATLPAERTPNKTALPKILRTDLDQTIYGSEPEGTYLVENSGVTKTLPYEEVAALNYDQLNVLNPKGRFSYPPVRFDRTAPVQNTNGAEQYQVWDMQDIFSYPNDRFPPEFAMSPNYILGDFLSSDCAPAGKKLVPYRWQGGTVPVKNIMYNLRQLVNSCLEPISRQWGRPSINSAVRRAGCPIEKDRDGNIIDPYQRQSDHNIGCAIDLSWPGKDWVYHVKVANWILTNIPFKQLLLETEDTKNASNPFTHWIHISWQIDIETYKPKRSKFQPVQMIRNGDPYRYSIISVEEARKN